jgi:hypothetical protein
LFSFPFPLLFTNFFSLSPLFFVSFYALPVPLGHFSSCPFSPYFMTESNPPSEFHCYWIVHCFHLLSPLSFPLSFSTIYYVSWSPSPVRGNFTME